jgi:hypothetical protein
MTPAGYLAKRVQIRVGFHADGVLDVYSVSSHVNDNFADYINFWKHNGYWLFDSPEIIQAVAQANHVQLDCTSLFYYEVYEMEFDGEELGLLSARAIVSYECPCACVQDPRRIRCGYVLRTQFA